MNTLMGHNLMRKDGEAHLAEKRVIFPAVSPRTVRDHWMQRFAAHTHRILDEIEPNKSADLMSQIALPVSAEALKEITGLTNITFREMNDWSQAMIDGIANYAGIADVESRCNAATASIDAAIDDMLPSARRHPGSDMLSVMLHAGMPMESTRANIKLAISGGQNEPRDAIAGVVWALLTHPDQKAMVKAGTVSWLAAFEEYARWISPIGMSPRRIAQSHQIREVTLDPEDRIFLMFSSANRDEAVFPQPDIFDITRDTSKSVAFGAGPHFCAGAAASRSLISDVALPAIFERLKALELDGSQPPVRFGGWAFRGVLNLPVRWR
jgi:cytochrome P450